MNGSPTPTDPEDSEHHARLRHPPRRTRRLHTLTWLLAAPVRSFTSKASGTRKTVIELRDPQRLSQSLTVFLDGDAGPRLESVAPRTPITLHVDEVRSGRARGELIATIERAAVEAAFERVGRSS